MNQPASEATAARPSAAHEGGRARFVQRVGIIGAPADLGQDRRGVDMGASAIRYAGLEAKLCAAGHEVQDFGNVSAPVPESMNSTSTTLKYLEPILAMATDLGNQVADVVREGWLPLVLGGDHSISLGAVEGSSRERRLGLIWLDAHGDFNTPETSPSGNIHGMVLAALTGRGDQRLVNLGGRAPIVEPSAAALLGVRDLDAGEKSHLRNSGVQVYTMHDIDRMGLPAVVELMLDRMDSGLDGLHVSLDMDIVDPLQAPGVGTPVLGGLSYRETHLALELIAASRRLASMDVVEVNPVLDTHNETARLAVEFALSALGKRIF
jgi:arginase